VAVRFSFLRVLFHDARVVVSHRRRSFNLARDPDTPILFGLLDGIYQLEVLELDVPLVLELTLAKALRVEGGAGAAEAHRDVMASRRRAACEDTRAERRVAQAALPPIDHRALAADTGRTLTRGESFVGGGVAAVAAASTAAALASAPEDDAAVAPSASPSLSAASRDATAAAAGAATAATAAAAGAATTATAATAAGAVTAVTAATAATAAAATAATAATADAGVTTGGGSLLAKVPVDI